MALRERFSYKRGGRLEASSEATPAPILWPQMMRGAGSLDEVWAAIHWTEARASSVMPFSDGRPLEVQ